MTFVLMRNVLYSDLNYQPEYYCFGTSDTFNLSEATKFGSRALVDAEGWDWQERYVLVRIA